MVQIYSAGCYNVIDEKQQQSRVGCYEHSCAFLCSSQSHLPPIFADNNVQDCSCTSNTVAGYKLAYPHELTLLLVY